MKVPAALESVLAAVPRERLLTGETPLSRFACFPDGPELVVKHDDAQSLAGGGNKLRKLEFIAAQARAKGADTLVTSGAMQSNHARATAGVAARLGMGCHLLLRDMVRGQPPEYRENGNQVYFSLFNATHEVLGADADIERATAGALAGLEAAGKKPFVVPFGGTNLHGCLGYVRCAVEIAGQFAHERMPDAVVLPLGSGGTYAGLLAGFHALGLNTRVIGYCVLDDAASARARVEGHLCDLAGYLGSDVPALCTRVEIDDCTLGAGYGLPAQDTLDALGWAGRTMGLVLDPVYTGKAMAGLLQAQDKGRFADCERLLFLHTGGQPGVFAYASTVMRACAA